MKHRFAKIILSIFLCLTLFLGLPLVGFANEYQFDGGSENSDGDIYSDLYDGIVDNGLESSIPDGTKQFVYDFSLTPEDPLSFENMFSADGLAKIFEKIKDYMLSPLKTAALLMTAILICAIIAGFKNEQEPTVNGAFKSFSTVVCTAIIISPIVLLCTDCAEVLNALSVFMNALIPIYSGLLVTAAKMGTALGFQTAVFIATQCVSYIGTYIVSPFSSMFLALSISAGVSGEGRLASIAEMIKKTAMWTMSIAMTVYMAVFSIKNVITTSADSAGARTARFLISSFVPIVGVSINEALSSMKGCLDILTRSVSIYAVIIMVAIVLPLLARLIFWRFVLSICSCVSDIFCTDTISVLLRSISAAVMILSAVVICSAIMFIFSITVLSHAAVSV